jgi:small subunit ribosomal protein S16
VLKIRLQRVGAKQEPLYRVVVSDGRQVPVSRSVDTLGSYDPSTDPPTVKLDVARAEEWIRKGAHPSETVKSIIERAIIERAKVVQA